MTQQIQIDKSVPIPSAGRGSGLPLAELNVGDSFFVPGDNKAHRRVRANILSFKERNPAIRLVTRVRAEEGALGIRVWRVV